jgi:predicted transcriptional regulator
VAEECGIEEIATLLEDDTVRTILTATSRQPMSASELSERCGVSEPTVYRRIDDMRTCDLLVERTQPDPEGGHHRQVYAPKLDRVTVTLDDGALDLRVEREPADMADRFTDLIEGM